MSKSETEGLEEETERLEEEMRRLLNLPKHELIREGQEALETGILGRMDELRRSDGGSEAFWRAELTADILSAREVEHKRKERARLQRAKDVSALRYRRRPLFDHLYTAV